VPSIFDFPCWRGMYSAPFVLFYFSKKSTSLFVFGEKKQTLSSNDRPYRKYKKNLDMS